MLVLVLVLMLVLVLELRVSVSVVSVSVNVSVRVMIRVRVRVRVRIRVKIRVRIRVRIRIRIRVRDRVRVKVSVNSTNLRCMVVAPPSIVIEVYTPTPRSTPASMSSTECDEVAGTWLVPCTTVMLAAPHRRLNTRADISPAPEGERGKRGKGG